MLDRTVVGGVEALLRTWWVGLSSLGGVRVHHVPAAAAGGVDMALRSAGERWCRWPEVLTGGSTVRHDVLAGQAWAGTIRPRWELICGGAGGGPCGGPKRRAILLVRLCLPRTCPYRWRCPAVDIRGSVALVSGDWQRGVGPGGAVGRHQRDRREH